MGGQQLRLSAWHPRETIKANTTVKWWPWIAKRR